MEEQHWMTLVRILDAPPWVSWMLALVAIPVVVSLGYYTRRLPKEEAPILSEADRGLH
jgi:hypothetical protein